MPSDFESESVLLLTACVDWQPDTSDECPEITDADVLAHVAAHQAWQLEQHIKSTRVQYYASFKPLTRCERAIYRHIAQLEEKYQIANPSIAQIMANAPYCERQVHSPSQKGRQEAHVL